MLIQATLARSGVQEYLGSELSSDPYEFEQDKRYSLWRDPADILDIDSIKSYSNCIVTMDHPPTLVDSKNSSSYVKGWVKKAWGVQSSDKDIPAVVRAELLICSGDLIDQIRGGLLEISVGYLSVDDYNVKMVDNNIRVDGVMKEIRANHVAILAEGRCGATCSIEKQIKADKKITTHIRKKTTIYTNNYIDIR